jgi:protein-tyrosine phosphatase
MVYPSPHTPWYNLGAAGFGHIICLESHGPVYDPSPLVISHRTHLQDLYGGRVPHDLQQEVRLIRQAVQAIVAGLQAGTGVVVHCAGGTGRTGTVIGCVLRGMGMTAVQVIAYLDRLHLARGRSGWPESEWQSQVVRSFADAGAWRDPSVPR